MAAQNPKIYIECSEELLNELHDAREAAHRSKKAGISTTRLDRLIVAIHNARKRAAAVKVAPDASAPAE